MINNELIEEFKKLYLEKYGIRLTDEEATRDAKDFLDLMRILTRSLPRKVNK
jgi:hypothetical protein